MSSGPTPEDIALAEDWMAQDPSWQREYKSKEKLKVKKRGTAEDVKSLAANLGYKVVTGGGRHGVQIQTKDGGFVCSVPSHGNKPLATGTYKGILNALGLEKRGRKWVRKED